MKRTPLRRKTPLRSSSRQPDQDTRTRTGLTRSTRLKAKGGSRFPKRRNRAFTAWVRTFACVVGDKHGGWVGGLSADARCLGVIDPAHVNKTRGAGAPDVGEVVPLCRKHHREQEGRTARFNAKYGVDLSRLAAELGARWEREQGEAA